MTAPNEPRDAVARTQTVENLLIRLDDAICARENYFGGTTVKTGDEVMADVKKAKDRIREHIAPRDAEIERLRGIIDGTDPKAGDPSKWGLRALLNGACGQRDATEAELVTLREQLAAAEARAEEATSDSLGQALQKLAVAEAALSEERARVAGMREVLRPFAACVFNDNFDVTLSTGRLSDRNWVALERLHRALTEEAGHAER